MSELLKKVAALLGVPENLIQRSAEARGEASGKSTEEVLQSWSGEETIESVEEAPQGEETIESVEEAPQGEETIESVEEAPQKGASVKFITSNKNIVIANKTMDIRQKADISIPRWINAVFIIVPIILLIGLINTSNIQECGQNGVLSIDRKTQTAVNCDGSKFEGKLVNINKINYIALGQEIYSGTAACAGCHGSNGGGGVGPEFIGGNLYTTFPTCSDHVKWVQLGSSGWQSEVGAEYGSENKISIGGMPAFQGKLSDEEIRSVVAFERVVFGGEAMESVLQDCGLVEDIEKEFSEETASSMP